MSSQSFENFAELASKIIAVGMNYSDHIKANRIVDEKLTGDEPPVADVGNAFQDASRSKLIGTSYEPTKKDAKSPWKTLNSSRCWARGRSEMELKGYAATPTSRKGEPLIFMKPTSAFVKEGSKIEIPPGCANLHHEVELGVVIGSLAKKVREEEAMQYVSGYTMALDMTDRDLQVTAIKNGTPWTIPKGFDTSCPVGSFIPKKAIPDPHALRIWCKVNGETRQDGTTSNMIFSIPFLISYITNYITLYPGDVVLTGTPAGVSGVKEGDVIEAGVGDLSKVRFEVGSYESLAQDDN